MRVVTVVGARPQFVKAAVVSPHLLEMGGIEETLIHTGQHYDANLSDVFFQQLGLRAPDYNLNVGAGSHGQQTARMLEGIERILIDGPADVVLLYGDTNSTLAGALAASKLRTPIAHVEAGVRSFNRDMPEETNRVLTDHASDLLFAPTATAVANLAREGIDGDRVKMVGDVMYDLALRSAERADAESSILERLGLESGDYFLATIHRAENTDHITRLRNVVAGLERASEEKRVVFPIHPRTAAAIKRERIELGVSGRVIAIDPVDYLDMISLEKNASVVVTDSGGVQKEAFFFGRPCVTVRTETEWVELVECGWNRLASPHHSSAIADAIHAAANDALPPRPDLYGDGNAGSLIARALLGFAR